MTVIEVYPKPQPTPRDALATETISPELQRHIDISRPDLVQERVQASFLRSAHTPLSEQLLGPLRAALYWHALPTCLEREGWRVSGQMALAMRPYETLTVCMGLLPLTRQEFLECPRNAAIFATRGEDRLVISFCEEATFPCPILIGLRSGVDLQPFWATWKEAVRERNPLRGRSLRANGRVIEEAEPPTWESAFLEEDLKEAIRFPLRRFLQHEPERLRSLGIRRRGGMILAGPPGTGKTLLGRVLSSSLGCTFLWTTPADLCDAESVREILDLARLLEPTVLFLEDLDILAEDRSRVRGTLTLGELMNQLDGFEGDHAVFTIATTNRVDVLEEAICNRPGRFDRVLEIPASSPAIAKAFLDHRLTPHGLSAQDLDWLADQNQGLTGAELEELANTVLGLALDEADEIDEANVNPPAHQALDLHRGLLERALAQRQAISDSSTAGFECTDSTQSWA